MLHVDVLRQCGQCSTYDMYCTVYDIVVDDELYIDDRILKDMFIV